MNNKREKKKERDSQGKKKKERPETRSNPSPHGLRAGEGLECESKFTWRTKVLHEE
jgi:hypothetical protein